jgi:hypothetical protein
MPKPVHVIETSCFVSSCRVLPRIVLLLKNQRVNCVSNASSRISL